MFVVIRCSENAYEKVPIPYEPGFEITHGHSRIVALCMLLQNSFHPSNQFILESILNPNDIIMCQFLSTVRHSEEVLTLYNQTGAIKSILTLIMASEDGIDIENIYNEYANVFKETRTLSLDGIVQKQIGWYRSLGIIQRCDRKYNLLI